MFFGGGRGGWWWWWWKDEGAWRRGSSMAETVSSTVTLAVQTGSHGNSSPRPSRVYTDDPNHHTDDPNNHTDNPPPPAVCPDNQTANHRHGAPVCAPRWSLLAHSLCLIRETSLEFPPSAPPENVFTSGCRLLFITITPARPVKQTANQFVFSFNCRDRITRRSSKQRADYKPLRLSLRQEAAP